MAEAVTDGRAAEPVTIDGRDIIVAYGSETGNAEDIAMELADMTRRLHFRTVVDELDNIKLVGSNPNLIDSAGSRNSTTHVTSGISRH